MDTQLLLFFVVLSGQVLGIVVRISGDRVVNKNGIFHVNCTSDTAPIGLEAEIQVDQTSYSIISTNDQCFSTELQNVCLFDTCQCASTGLWFSHSFRAFHTEGLIGVSCSMVFGSRGRFYDSKQVRIIDFSDPKITTDEDFPISVGKLVKFTCRVTGTPINMLNVTVEWNCLNNKTKTYKIGYSAIYVSEITRKIHLKHHNQTCDCNVNIDGYIATSRIQVTVSKYPGIQIEKTALCNKTEKVRLSCTLVTEVPSNGFSAWIHSYQGTYLRSLQGKNHGKESILVIESCSFEDNGAYTCVVWNEFDGTKFYENNTMILRVNSPPVIVSATMIREQNITLSVLFCSLSNTTHMWSKQNKSIENLTQMTQTLSKRVVEAIVYNQTIDCDGYVSNLSLHNTTTGKYVLILRNEFGKTRQTLNVELAEGVRESFDFRMVVFVLIAIGIFIVTASGTVIIVRCRSSSNVVQIVGPHERSTVPIYHSAPSSEPLVRIYDTVNAGYLEVIDNDHRHSHDSENDKESEENEGSLANNVHDYEEID